MLAVFSLACASSGTRPHEMSVAGHEAAAEREAAEAAEHQAQYDPKAISTTYSGDSIGWDLWINPTSPHLARADRHRRLAQEHRAAAEALREAEARACQGVAERDRDLSPFFQRADIVRVELPGGGEGGDPIVVFRRVPGLTQASLQALIDCHLARSASMNHEMPEMDYCPLAIEGVHATVSEAPDGLAVTLSAAKPRRREELFERVSRLQA